MASEGRHGVRELAAGAAVIVTAAISGCLDGAAPDAWPRDHETLPILRQFVVQNSRESRPMRVVVRDAATWARVPLLNEPVDFSREMALVVTLGRVVSDQYRVRITRVWREGRRLRVELHVTEPPADAPLAPGGPFCVAIVPRCELEVEGFATEPPPVRD